MRILLINDYSTPTGGAELQFLDLRRELRARGHAVRLFSTSAPGGPGPRTADHECFGTVGRGRALLQTYNPWAVRRLRAVLQSFDPEVVHLKLFLTQLSPWILPLLRGRPTLYQAVWYRSICPTGSKWLPSGRECHQPAGWCCFREGCLPLHDWVPLSLQMKLWWRWRGALHRIVANSEFTKSKLENEGLGPVEVIYNGVSERPDRGERLSFPTLAYAGSLIPRKGVATLLRALAELIPDFPEVLLLVAGGGSQEGRLRELSRELALEDRVRWLGHLSRERMEEALGPAWIQVVPSLWQEPFGNVAVEAAMRATPVVASRVGGLKEIVIEGETGLLVPPGEPGALAAGLRRLLSDPKRVNELGQNGRQRALSKFLLSRTTDRFLDLYRELVDG